LAFFKGARVRVTYGAQLGSWIFLPAAAAAPWILGLRFPRIPE